MKLILSLLALQVLMASVAIAGKYVVCYYGTWATYRTGAGKFTVDNIDPTLCTHLNYAFFGINADGTIAILDAYLALPDNYGLNAIGKMNNLKQTNPSLKTIASIGGWNAGAATFSAVANSASLRANFATQARAFCQKYGFDGIDIDWEYPAQRDGNPSVDKANFILMLQSLNAELKKYGLLLTVAVGASQGTASISYNIPQVASNVDFINLMEYDFHMASDGFTGNNAPLYAGAADLTAVQKQNNVAASVQYWLSQGAPASKLVLGIPQYGRSFTLSNAANHGVGAAASGGGTAGPYTQEAGYLGYNEICQNLQSGTWTTVWDSVQMVPYSYSGNQWVGYDNVQSINAKCAYINSNGLAGGMFWSIETDDFLGQCGPKFGLTSALKSCLASGSTPTTTTSKPVTTTTTTTSKPVTTTTGKTTTTTTTTAKTPTTPSGGGSVCTTDGFFRNPTDCSKFYRCVSGIRYDFACSTGLYFSPAISGCDWAWNVSCP